MLCCPPWHVDQPSAACFFLGMAGRGLDQVTGWSVGFYQLVNVLGEMMHRNSQVNIFDAGCGKKIDAQKILGEINLTSEAGCGPTPTM